MSFVWGRGKREMDDKEIREDSRGDRSVYHLDCGSGFKGTLVGHSTYCTYCSLLYGDFTTIKLNGLIPILTLDVVLRRTS